MLWALTENGRCQCCARRSANQHALLWLVVSSVVWNRSWIIHRYRPGSCCVRTVHGEVSGESFWMPDLPFPALQLEVKTRMMQTKWISFCWCMAQRCKQSQTWWDVISISWMLFQRICLSVSPSLQPTSSRVARTLGLFGMASWLAQTSASGWLCRLNVSRDILWLEKLRSRACTESAGTGITHSRDVKVTQKDVPSPLFLSLFYKYVMSAER